MDCRIIRPLLVVVGVSTGCLRADDEPEFVPDPGLCFQTRSIEVPMELADERWIAADLDADGQGDLVAIEGTTRWTLHPFYGSAGDVPFVLDDPVVIDLGIPLGEARIVFADADGDGDTDLATYHDDRIFIVEGPLTGAPLWTESPAPGLHPARGEFVDFDEDGRLDFVMREGTGDNLVSYRGLDEGGFELVGEAEFHPDTFCVDQILAEDRDDDWFIVAGNACPDIGRIRVAAFSVNADGTMEEFAAQEFDKDLLDRDLSLRMVGNLLDETSHEVLINDSIWAVERSSLVEEEDGLSSKRRGDFDGDGVVDHAVISGARVDLSYGGERAVVRQDEIRFVDLEPVYDSRELLEPSDVDGDGIDDVTMLQLGVDVAALVVGSNPAPCEE